MKDPPVVDCKTRAYSRWLQIENVGTSQFQKQESYTGTLGFYLGLPDYAVGRPPSWAER